jgi:two-component system nitrogen regulation response regulator GlnG
MAHLLVVDDEESICWGLAKLCKELGHTTTIAASAEEALAQAAVEPPDAIILDIRLPGIDGLSAMQRLQTVAGGAPVIIITAFGSLDTAVTAVRNGAFDYLTKPFDLDQAAAIIQRATCQTAREAVASTEPPLVSLPDELLGHSPAMQQVFKRIALAAPSEVPVLITGESGTGKELVARAIHRHSLKCSAPLLSVNLAALSPTLVESELFGHVRGAFTGADAARRGLLELANGATVFFDEIGDISPPVQVKLLRVLEQHEVTPVGDTTPRPTQFRVIAATNRDLTKATAQSVFREDLYFRLAGFEINLPPLRDRLEDVPLLAEHFLALTRAAGATATGFTSSAIEELCQRRWPGNVRELRHAVEHAALLARGGVIGPEHFPSSRSATQSLPEDASAAVYRAVRAWAMDQLAGEAPPANLYDRFLATVEKPLFDVVLEKTDHNRSAAADVLGIHRATLRKKLDSHG